MTETFGGVQNSSQLRCSSSGLLTGGYVAPPSATPKSFAVAQDFRYPQYVIHHLARYKKENRDIGDE